MTRILGGMPPGDFPAGLSITITDGKDTRADTVTQGWTVMVSSPSWEGAAWVLDPTPVDPLTAELIAEEIDRRLKLNGRISSFVRNENQRRRRWAEQQVKQLDDLIAQRRRLIEQFNLPPASPASPNPSPSDPRTFEPLADGSADAPYED